MKVNQFGNFGVGINKGNANIGVVNNGNKDAVIENNNQNEQNDSLSKERKKKFIELIFSHWFWAFLGTVGAISSIYSLFK